MRLAVALTNGIKDILRSFFAFLYNFRVNNLSQIGVEAILALVMYELIVWL